MPGASGQYAYAQLNGGTNLLECTGWSMDDSVREHPYASCATSGYFRRIAGTRDASGTIDGVFDPDNPIHDQIEPGDIVILNLLTKAAKGHYIPAMIVSLNHAANVEEGEVIRWSANWGADGQFYLNEAIPFTPP